MAEASKPDRMQFSLLTAIVATLLVGSGLGIAVAVYNVIQDAGEAERTLHATHCVFRVVGRFMEEHRGRWPESWGELETTKDPTPTIGMYEWPRDSKTIQRRVKIDFTLRVEDLEKQSESTFTAIRAIGPTYPYSEYANQLIELAQKYRKSGAPVSQK